MSASLRSLLVCGMLCAWSVATMAQSLRYLGRQVVPHALEVGGTRVGGLSGIDYLPLQQRYVAISDDRSEHAPARFYELELDLAAFNTQPSPGYAGVRFLSATTLKDENGVAYASGTVDPEAIRLDPGSGRLYWTSEGNARKRIAPAIVEMNRDGMARRHINFPSCYRPQDEAGVRDNLAFEGLALDASTRRLYVATENALTQDGPVADVDHGSPSRLLVADLTSHGKHEEFVYLVEPVPVRPPLPLLYRTNGLVELLASDGLLLALERAYVQGIGNFVRIYRFDLTGATNVAGHESLREISYVPVKKTLLFDLSTLEFPLDNLEGMAWGPRSANGRQTLILVSDNNFSLRQVTQFLAFELIE